MTANNDEGWRKSQLQIIARLKAALVDAGTDAKEITLPTGLVEFTLTALEMGLKREP